MNRDVKVPEEFILDCMNNKRINLIHVFIEMKLLLRKRPSVTGKELQDNLTKYFKKEYTYELLKKWRHQPFVDYCHVKDIYRLNKNVEKYYYENTFNPNIFNGLLKVPTTRLKYTGNKLTSFLFCELVYSNRERSYSREFLTKLTSLSKPTQIKAEKLFNVNVKPQFIMVDAKRISPGMTDRKLKFRIKEGNKVLIQHTNVFGYKNVLERVKVKQRLSGKQSHLYIHMKKNISRTDECVFRFTDTNKRKKFNILYPGGGFEYGYLIKENLHW